VNLSNTVREYIDPLVHPSARQDPLTAAKHRGFIASRLIAALTVLTALPLYLPVRGAPTALEIGVFSWFVAPIGLAYLLSRTGRYELAHVLSAVAMGALVFMVALQSGDIASPAVIWLALVPVEAALCTSRRTVAIASATALGVAAALFALTSPESGASHAAVAVALAGAIAYAAALAFGAESFTRASSRLLNQEEDRYRLLALNMTDVISRHAPNGTLLFISPACERLLGTPAADLLGHGLFDRVHVADRPAFLSAFGDAAASPHPRSVEFRLRREPALGAPHFVWVEMRCRAVAAGPDDTRREIVAVMRDVTSRKQQESAIEEARSEAELANAAKGRFLATMSHELRTPLNAVIGFSEMLMQEATLNIDVHRRRDYARLIHDSGHHLLSVVNVVLDMSKIESGNFVITPEPFAPAAVICSSCDLLALKAREAGLDIVVRMPADLPEIVADKRALKQMLLNLLSNAVKFTGAGGCVTVSATADATHLGLVVEDTGVGISASDLCHVGDPFFQARGSYDRPYEGTGLGLSIVKGLVGLHGGELQVASELGHGTRVTIRLPLDCEMKAPESRGAVVPLAPVPAARTTHDDESPRWSEMKVKKSA
jgi:cell cycle sensor histidine kinase DivJ